MSAQVAHALVTAAIMALIAWRLYARVRRHIGRQRFSARRPWFTVCFFPLVVLGLVFGAHLQPLAREALIAGVVIGAALGVLGLRLTRFEATAEGLFYTPSAHLGIALSALLVCRILYRVMAGGAPGPGPGAQPPPLTPLTVLLVGTLAGYYSAYAAGLLRWSARTRSLPAPEVAP